MANYLVLKRLTRNSKDVSFSGEVIELDEEDRETTILQERGYITVVPPGYKGSTARKQAPAPAPTPNGDEEQTVESLSKLKREDLEGLAKELGIEDPDSKDTYPNKEALATAILSKKAEEETAAAAAAATATGGDAEKKGE